MKYRIFDCAALLMSVLTVSGCLAQDYTEPDPAMEPDTDLIHVPCDLVTNEKVTTSFKIRSNRAWSASLPEDCDWVHLSSTQESNLANASMDYPIDLVFENNEGEERTAQLKIRTNYEEKVVTIRQDAITPRLVVTSSKYIDNIASEGGTFQVDLLSNVRWACSVDEKSTASISMDKNAGKYNSSVVVTVAESPDKFNMSKARLRFRAAGCEDQVVEFIQLNAEPYVLFAEKPERNLYSIGETFSLLLKTNSNWTASIDEGADKILSLSVSGNSRDISSGTFSGSKSDVSISVLCQGNNDVDNTAPIRFSFTPEGGDPMPLEVRIDPLSHMVFLFLETGSKTFNSPFKTPTKSNFATSGNSKKWGGEYYPLVCYNSSLDMYIYTPADGGVWRNSSQGFRASSSTGTDIRDGNMVYLKLPVVPGKALTKVSLINGYETNIDIRALDNSVPKGGTSQVTSTVGDELVWELSGTQKDSTYCIVASTGNFGIHKFELWYE